MIGTLPKKPQANREQTKNRKMEKDFKDGKPPYDIHEVIALCAPRAMFVTIGAEKFGPNLRATAATTMPNMVRGKVV